MKVIKVKHIRKNGIPYGTFVLCMNDGNYYAGASLCRKDEDNFVKKEGIRQAVICILTGRSIPSSIYDEFARWYSNEMAFIVMKQIKQDYITLRDRHLEANCLDILFDVIKMHGDGV